MAKEERIKQVAETAQKALYAFSDTANELPELQATELLIILYGVFLDAANNLELDPDELYLLMKKGIGYTKTAMKRFLNIVIVASFFSVVAATIWVVWDQREVVLNTFYTALIVFMAVLVCKEVWIIAKELRR